MGNIWWVIQPGLTPVVWADMLLGGVGGPDTSPHRPPRPSLASWAGGCGTMPWRLVTRWVRDGGEGLSRPEAARSILCPGERGEGGLKMHPKTAPG